MRANEVLCRDDVRRFRRMFRAVRQANRIALMRTLAAASGWHGMIRQLDEADRRIGEALARLPIGGVNLRTGMGECRVNIEQAVKINAMLHRKRAALAEERARATKALTPIVTKVLQLRTTECVAEAKDKEVSRLLRSALEGREDSAAEEQWREEKL